MLLVLVMTVKVPLLVLLRLQQVSLGSLKQVLDMQDKVSSPSMATSLDHHIKWRAWQLPNGKFCGNLPSTLSNGRVDGKLNISQQFTPLLFRHVSLSQQTSEGLLRGAMHSLSSSISLWVVG